MLNLKKILNKICSSLSSFFTWSQEVESTLELYEEDNNSVIDKTLSSTVSMVSSTYYNILSVELTPGTWLLTGFVRFGADASSTGRRYICIGPNTATNNGTCANSKLVPDSGHPVYSNVTYITQNSTTRKYYLIAWHNKGAKLNCDQAALHATRLHKPIS